MNVRIERAQERDVPLILELIRGLAEYERLADQCVATEAGLRDALSGGRVAGEGDEDLRRRPRAEKRVA